MNKDDFDRSNLLIGLRIYKKTLQIKRKKNSDNIWLCDIKNIILEKYEFIGEIYNLSHIYTYNSRYN